MKTALFVTTFLHGKDPYSTFPRIDRIFKHLQYYSNLKKDLGFDQIYVSDNGGNGQQIALLLNQFPDIELIRHPLLERGPDGPPYDYLPCWRALYDYKKVISDGFEKIIVMDDDAYILSDRLINHVSKLDHGWTTLWCNMYDFPESALSILCKGAFPIYERFTNEPFESHNKSTLPFEYLIPYTQVYKSFNCDRWGENRIPQVPGADAYFQCPVDIEMTPWK